MIFVVYRASDGRVTKALTSEPDLMIHNAVAGEKYVAEDQITNIEGYRNSLRSLGLNRLRYNESTASLEQIPAEG